MEESAVESDWCYHSISHFPCDNLLCSQSISVVSNCLLPAIILFQVCNHIYICRSLDLAFSVIANRSSSFGPGVIWTPCGSPSFELRCQSQPRSIASLLVRVLVFSISSSHLSSTWHISLNDASKSCSRCDETKHSGPTLLISRC